MSLDSAAGGAANSAPVAAGGGVEAGGRAPAGGSGSHGLFGRSLLYVVVGSVQFLVATVVSPVLAYTLGPTGLGLMASAIALHQVLVVLAAFGLDQALVLQRAEDGSDSSARGLVAAGILASTTLTVIVAVTAPLWARSLGFNGFDELLVATVLWTAPATIVQLVLALLTGQDRLRAFMVVSFLSTAGSQAVGLTLVFVFSRTAATYAWGGVVGQVAAMVLGVVLVRPRMKAVLETKLMRGALVLGLPMMMSGISGFVLNAGDRLVIQSILGAAEAGRYQVAYTIGSIVVLLMTLTGQAWAARISSVRDDAQRWRLLGDARDALLRLLAPAVLGLTLGAPLLLRVLAPASFQPTTLLAVVLLVALSSIPAAAGQASSRALITERRARPIAVAAATAAVVNLGLCLVLVPRWGLSGAAAATTVAFTVQSFVQWWSLPRRATWPRTPARVQQIVLLAAALAAASIALPQDLVWIVVRTVAGAACLPWLLYALARARRPPA